MILKFSFCLIFLFAQTLKAQNYDIKVEGNDTFNILPEGVHYLEFSSEGNKGFRRLANKLPDGKWIMYNDNFNEEWSTIIYFSIFENLLTDTVRIYSTEDILIKIGEYERGHRTGTWEYFYESGQLRIRTIVEYGLTLESVRYFENGRKESRFIQIFNNNGIKKYLITEWFENGKLKEQGVLFSDIERSDLKIGEWREWYMDGLLKFRGYYEKGEKNGEFRYFNEFGELDKIEIYKKDKLRKVMKFEFETINEGRLPKEKVYNSKGKLIKEY